MKLLLTEIKGEWNKNNHKVPSSRVMEGRLCHTYHFPSQIKKLASDSRKKYFFAFAQESSGRTRHRNEDCIEVSTPTNLLWIDVDQEVDLEDLYYKFKEHKISGFAYYTSAYYANEGRSHVRIGVVTKEPVPMDSRSCIYARQFVYQIGLKVEIDTSKYHPRTYYAPVVSKDGYWDKTIFATVSKLWIWKDVDEGVKSAVKDGRTNIGPEYGAGEIGKLAVFLKSLGSIKQVSVYEDTLNIVSDLVKERTEGGYYLRPSNSVWEVFHADLKDNKNRKLRYVNGFLTKEEFELYKDYITNYSSLFHHDIEHRNIKYDEVITDNNRYLKPDIINKYLDRNGKRKALIIDSPTGSGKSSRLAEWINSHDLRCLFISTGRNQARQTYRSLIERGISSVCYIPTSHRIKSVLIDGERYNANFKKSLDSKKIPPRVICGILSLHLFLPFISKEPLFDVVIIDEVSSVPYKVGGMYDLLYDVYERLVDDMNVFFHLLRQAKYFIGMDGYVSPSVLSMIKAISNHKDIHIVRKINRIPYKKVSIFVTSSYTQPTWNREDKISCKKFFGGLTDDIDSLDRAKQKGIKKGLLLVANTFCSNADTTEDFIKLRTENRLNVKKITKETEKKGLSEVSYLMEYLDDKDIQVLVYSPSISTGVDIPQVRGQNVYHMMNGIGKTWLPAREHYQMTMRGRNPNSYRVLIPRILNSRKRSDSKFYITPSVSEGLNKIKIFGIKVHPKTEKTDLYVSGLGSCGQAIYRTLKQILKQDSLSYKKIIADKKAFGKYTKDLPNRDTLRTLWILEEAYLEERYKDWEKGITGRYIELLKHENCNVSMEEDIERPIRSYKKLTDHHRIEVYRDQIENILGWQGGVFTKGGKSSIHSVPGMWKFREELKTKQRIYLAGTNRDHAQTEKGKAATKTAQEINKVFKRHKITFETGSNGERTHEKVLIELFNHLCGNQIGMEKILANKLDPKPKGNFADLSDRQRIARVKYILSWFFDIEIIRRRGGKWHEYILTPNLFLKRSIDEIYSDPFEGPLDRFRRFLYI